MTKKSYMTPSIAVEEVIIEQGIAASWGESGMAGQDGDFGMYDEEL